MNEFYGKVDEALLAGNWIRFRTVDGEYQVTIRNSMSRIVHERTGDDLIYAARITEQDPHFLRIIRGILYDDRDNMISFYMFPTMGGDVQCSIEDADTRTEIVHGAGPFANDALKAAHAAYEKEAGYRLP